MNNFYFLNDKSMIIKTILTIFITTFLLKTIKKIILSRQKFHKSAIFTD